MQVVKLQRWEEMKVSVYSSILPLYVVMRANKRAKYLSPMAKAYGKVPELMDKLHIFCEGACETLRRSLGKGDP